jgi:hypothetical protein
MPGYHTELSRNPFHETKKCFVCGGDISVSGEEIETEILDRYVSSSPWVERRKRIKKIKNGIMEELRGRKGLVFIVRHNDCKLDFVW